MRFSYVWRELTIRRRRHLTAILGLAVGIALLVILQALAGAYQQAARAPLAEIGADITIQRSGDVPQNLQGAVFPCSAVTIRKQEVEQISRTSGVRATGQALLLWVFDQERFTMVMGVDPANSLGPGKLRNFMVKGRFLEGESRQALVENTYAKEKQIEVGDTVTILDIPYPVVGLVDGSRASKIALANVYLPLSEAQALAVASPQVQGVSPFAMGDVNLVFMVADQAAIPSLAVALKTALGDKTSVATPASFLRQLGNLFALSDKFASATSGIVMVVAFLMVFKTIAGGIQERAREIGVLKCLGWTNANINAQLLAESLVLCLLAGIVGVGFAGLVCFGLSFQELHIPIPWEMSPTPHFLPGGGEPVFKTVRLPVQLSWPLIGLALILSLIVGAITSVLCIGRITRIKPSEVLRHE
jgi:ABC-type antimicrobial peptide transport system permease subunit